MADRKEQLRNIFDGLRGKDAFDAIYRRELKTVMEFCGKHVPGFTLDKWTERGASGLEYRMKMGSNNNFQPLDIHLEIHFSCSGTARVKWEKNDISEPLADFYVARHRIGAWLKVVTPKELGIWDLLAVSREQPLRDVFHGFCGRDAIHCLYDRELKAAIGGLQALIPELTVKISKVPSGVGAALDVNLRMGKAGFCARLAADGKKIKTGLRLEREAQNFPHLRRQIGVWIQEHAAEQLKDVKRAIGKEIQPQTAAPLPPSMIINKPG